MRKLPIVFSLALGLCWAPGARAQAYDRLTGQSAYTPITTLGATALSFSDPDDGSATISLPFDVTYFGVLYPAGSPLQVSVNGFVALGTSSSEYENVGIPFGASPNGFIAGFWDDLELGSGGVYHGVFSLTTGEQVLVVEYAGVQVRAQPASVITFQIWIMEGGSELDLHFGSIGNAVFGSASIGIESPSGAEGLPETCTPSCTSLDLTAEQFIAFVPRGTQPPLPADLVVTSQSAAPAQAAVGASFDLQLEVRNQGETAAAGFDVLAVLDQNGLYEVSDPVLGRTSVSSGLSAGQVRSLTLRGTVPSSASGSYVVRVVADPAGLVSEEDRTNNMVSAGNITIPPATPGFEITTRTLPPAVVSEAYSYQLEASAGSNPIWSIVTGDPGAGLSLSASGVLAGIPTIDGTYAFRVQATDSALGSATWDFVLNVVPPGGLRLVAAALPRGAVGSPYSARLAASGGSPPYAFLAVSGSPAWLQLRSDGELSGTPDAAGVHFIEISVADSAGGFAGGTLRLEVAVATPLVVVTRSLPRGVVDFPYQVRLAAEGGQPPYSWTVSSNGLPSGLSLAPDGLLVGTPLEEHRGAVSLRVEDTLGASARVELSLEIEALRPLAIVMPTRVAAKLNTENTIPLLAEGGVPPYSFSIAAGRLPEGLELSVQESESRFTGVPTSTVPELITLVVTDIRLESAEAEITLVATVDGSATLPRGGERARRDSSGCGALERAHDDLPWLVLGLFGVLWVRRGRALPRRAKRLDPGRGASVRASSHEDRGYAGTGLRHPGSDHRAR